MCVRLLLLQIVLPERDNNSSQKIARRVKEGNGNRKMRAKKRAKKKLSDVSVLCRNQKRRIQGDGIYFFCNLRNVID